MEEQTILARLKQGDLAALEPLVQQYQALAVHAAYLIVADRFLAEEIVQTAFVKVAEKIGTFDMSRPFRPWFLRMVVNDSLKAARRQRRTLPLEAPPGAVLNWLTDPTPGPEDLAETNELRQEVWKALRQLPPEQRAVIIQRHFLEMDESEMAQTLQKPSSTVKWWLFQGRQRLRALLAAYRNASAEDRPCNSGYLSGVSHEKR